MTVNKYGLKRHPPEAVKRDIRRRSKFGCVVCRSAVYEYEHIDPEFHEARTHDPEHICLLCGHCHGKVTRGHLSKETVARKYQEVQTSDNIRRPFDQFDLDHNQITVVLGSSRFIGAESLIVLGNEVVLAINPPEEGAAFPTLSGYFTDEKGNELMRVVKNEWVGGSTAWDMEIKGKEIFIRSGPGEIALHLQVDPPHTIAVKKLNMRVGNSHLMLKDDLLVVGRISDDAECFASIERLECVGASVGVLVDEQGVRAPEVASISIAGGEGIELHGAGVRLAVGSESLCLKGLRIEDANKFRTLVVECPLTHSLFCTTTIHPPRI